MREYGPRLRGIAHLDPGASNMQDNQLALIYQVSESTIRRWRRAGVKTSTPTPFINPAEMPSWWQKMMDVGEFEKGCPAGVIAAANEAGKSSSDGEEGTDTDLAQLLANINSGQAFGYADGIRVAERNVMVTDFLLLRAVKAGDERRVGPLQKRLNEAQDSLRALLRDRGRIQAEAGETLPKSEVRAAMLEIHGNITRRFRQSLKFAYAEAEGRTSSREAWDGFIDATVDEICRVLSETKFAAPEEIAEAVG